MAALPQAASCHEHSGAACSGRLEAGCITVRRTQQRALQQRQIGRQRNPDGEIFFVGVRLCRPGGRHLICGCGVQRHRHHIRLCRFPLDQRPLRSRRPVAAVVWAPEAPVLAAVLAPPRAASACNVRSPFSVGAKFVRLRVRYEERKSSKHVVAGCSPTFLVACWSFSFLILYDIVTPRGASLKCQLRN